MELRFRIPERRTRIRFFASKTALLSALSHHREAFSLQDDAVPLETDFYRIPGGEIAKNWEQLGAMLEVFSSERLERGRPLLIIGGGAVCDLGAFAASLYRRGMPLILVPSTLLAMVDAAVGGKTAVDHGALKNFAGTFYPADEVWICPELLSSLPARERISGAGELWKMLWLSGAKAGDAALLEFLRTGNTSRGLLSLLKRALEAKCRVVEKDPLDQKRIREALNFGHTAGHALEAAAQGALSHGEAVLWGMAVETTLLGARGAAMTRIVGRAIGASGLALPPVFQAMEESSWLELLSADKKMKGGMLELTLLTALGRKTKLRCEPARLARALRAFPGSWRLEA